MPKQKSKTIAKEQNVKMVKAITTAPESKIVREKALKESTCVVTRSTASNKVVTIATFSNKKKAKEFHDWLERKGWLLEIDDELEFELKDNES